MSESGAQHRTAPVAFPRLFTLPRAVVGAAYLGGYVLLDWISFINPIASYGITPWNPPTGLSFALVLIFGQRMIPFLFAAPFLADLLVRRLPFSWTLELTTTTIIGVGYSLALLFLLRPKTRFNPALTSLRDLFLLLAATAASAALVATGYVGAVIASGLLAQENFFQAFARFWIGDVIGVAIITPFALMHVAREPRLRLSLEVLSQFVAVVLALWLIFNVARDQQLQLFYVLFLPIVWVAVRSGLQGVTAGLLIAQLGLIVGVGVLPIADLEVTEIQALMLVLAMTGLMAGALVTERRRTELQLRLHQESLARLTRLGSIGEFAAAIAHEVNQPIMAAGTYSRLVLETLHRGGHNDPSIIETASKAVAQVERASGVVSRLRALVRLDKTERAPTTVAHIVSDAISLCRPDLDRCGIKIRTLLENSLPPVIVDVLQIEQVLINLMRNSIEAVTDEGGSGGVITIEAKRGRGEIEVTVSDNGPGFPAELLANQLLPFATTKAEGLGMGLSLSRTIIEAHGGQLTTESNLRGAIVRLTLPTAGT